MRWHFSEVQFHRALHASHAGTRGGMVPEMPRCEVCVRALDFRSNFDSSSNATSLCYLFV